MKTINCALYILLQIRTIVGENEYDTYPEIPYDKGSMESFTDGMKYYKPMYIDNQNLALFVGSMNTIYKLNLLNISKKDKMYYKTVLPLDSDVELCLSKFGPENNAYDCQNHFRVIEKNEDGRIYACSTGSHAPKDFLFSNNLERYSPYPPEGIGVGKCPFDPRSSHAYVWSSSNNPFNAESIYSGTYRDIDKLDAFIYRPPIYDNSSQKQMLPFIRTVTQSLKVLNEPEFIRALEMENCIYFFFNEVAIELTQCHDDNIVPTVARICKKDKGGQSVSTNYWATYIKARLNCSYTITNENSYSQRLYFNKLKDIYRSRDHDSQNYQFYALFESSKGQMTTSAVCIYNLFDVDNALKSNFMRRSHAYSPWTAVPSNEVPAVINKNRQCSNETDTYLWNDDAIYFMNEHPLTQNAVQQEFDQPLLVKQNLNLKKIVIDQVVGSDQIEPYSIIYGITDSGKLYKIVYWYEENGFIRSNIICSYHLFQKSVVNDIAILSAKYLYVTTNHEILQVKNAQCFRYLLCAQCIRDPHCGWDRYTGICLVWNSEKSQKLIQAVRTDSDALCHIEEKFSTLKVINLVGVLGDYIHLKCEVPSYLTQHSPNAKKSFVVWYHNNNEIKFNQETLLETVDAGIILLNLNASSSGSYKCMIRQQIIKKYEIDIDSATCSLIKTKEMYTEKYKEWCKEFESYKREFNIWKLRQKECQTNIRNVT